MRIGYFLRVKMESWVKTELAAQDMGDVRLNKRMAKLTENLCRDPSLSIPCANTTWAETLAAYRFFDNEKVTFDSIMSGHKESTLKRIQAEPIVLIPQDTTFLNFATDDKSKEMGTLRSKKSNQQMLHTSIAISPSRVNLGVVDGSMWQREEASTGRSRSDKKIDEKESHRWLLHYHSACSVQAQSPDTTVVSIADREGDIHEWFQYAETVPIERRASYIIRAKANRALELEDERISLWDHMNSLKSLGKYSVNVPKRNGEPGRDASVDVLVAEVQLAGKGKARQPLFLHVVYLKEKNPPAGTKGIEWMLLTDLPVEDFIQARVIIEWYRCRWEIETYFRVMKGSCEIENSRFRTEPRMLNCIAVYMIISWRSHSITMLARRIPERPCTDAFSDREWTILWRMRTKSLPPKIPPSLREATHMLAGLGGFLGRKGDGEPGVKTIWQGYDKLLHYIEAADAFGV